MERQGRPIRTMKGKFLLVSLNGNRMDRNSMRAMIYIKTQIAFVRTVPIGAPDEGSRSPWSNGKNAPVEYNKTMTPKTLSPHAGSLTGRPVGCTEAVLLIHNRPLS
jgi:hypothetical protein